MNPWLQLCQMAFLSLATSIGNPLFWLVFLLVMLQYKKIIKMEVSVLGIPKHSIKEKMLNALGMGLLGGAIGTLFFMLLGITIQPKDFAYILPMAVFLMMINARYICFSYAGGLLSLFSLIFGFPQISVSSIMAMVALLHLIESMLIWLDGAKDATPIFIKDPKYGVIGGFMLQRFWPIPFTVLLLSMGIVEGARDLSLPDWWPLFETQFSGSDPDQTMLQISVVVAALGYGDVALTATPEEKTQKSALRLLTYSMALLIFSIFSTKLQVFKYIAALFAPIGHEALIIYGQREERRRKPIFRSFEEGVTVLDVLQGGCGAAMGLKPGDVMLRINNRIIENQGSIRDLLDSFPPYIWIDIATKKGFRKTLEYKDYERGIGNLGIIVIPEQAEVLFQPQTSFSLGKKLMKKIFGKQKTTM